MTSLVDLSVTDRYRSAADGFARRIAGTTDWDAPTPVAQWRARDVVGHLTTWLPALLASGCEVRLSPVPSADVDPVGAWAGLDAQLRSLLDDPATEEVLVEVADATPEDGAAALDAAVAAGPAWAATPARERAEILRKLEESRQRNLSEQQRLAEEDKRRAEEAAERKRQAEAEAGDGHDADDDPGGGGGGEA